MVYEKVLFDVKGRKKNARMAFCEK